MTKIHYHLSTKVFFCPALLRYDSLEEASIYSSLFLVHNLHYLYSVFIFASSQMTFVEKKMLYTCTK